MWQIQGKTPAINQTDKPILEKSDLFAAFYQGDQSSHYTLHLDCVYVALEY